MTRRCSNHLSIQDIMATHQLDIFDALDGGSVRGSSIAPSDIYSSTSSESEVMDLMSDTSASIHGDEERKHSPAPTTTSSVQITGEVMNGYPGTSFDPVVIDDGDDKDDKKKPATKKPRAPPVNPRRGFSDAEATTLMTLREAGLSNAQIAERMGRTVASISSYMQRHRARAQKLLATLSQAIPGGVKQVKPEMGAVDVKPRVVKPGAKRGVPPSFQEEDIKPTVKRVKKARRT